MESHESPLVYVFRSPSGAVCSAASGDDVLAAFGDLERFSDYFGGHMVFGWPPSAAAFLGVWGQRNAQRFRRLMRQHHGGLTLVHRPPPVRLTLISRLPARPDRDRRAGLERLLPAS